MASSPGSDIVVRLILSLCALMFSAALFVTRWLHRAAREHQAQHWPSVTAVVHNSFELNDRSTNVAQDDPARYVFWWITALEYSYQVNGEFYAGTYFLPSSYTDSSVASAEGKAWLGRKITVRYNPSNPEKSFFLETDGAPGKSRIPRSRENRPYVTTLSLK